MFVIYDVKYNITISEYRNDTLIVSVIVLIINGILK